VKSFRQARSRVHEKGKWRELSRGEISALATAGRSSAECGTQNEKPRPGLKRVGGTPESDSASARSNATISTASKNSVLPRLRLRISPAAESEIRSGHPWLFAGSVREQNREGEPGELAAVYDRKNKVLALGLYDPHSPLRLRVLHTGKPVTIDAAWWSERFRVAIARRDGLFDLQTTGYRLIHGESDGWPGLVLDRYHETLVLKLYTGAWLPRLGEIKRLIGEQLHPERIVLRLSRNLQTAGEKTYGVADGQVLAGGIPAASQVFLESRLQFEVDVLRGQKTGFFLDQRENRRAVELLSRGRDVLNAFSFTGGFSVYAARGGARSVIDLDISEHALAGSHRNFGLNRHHPAVATCRHETIQADAFDWVEKESNPQFDLVILDPPSLAKRELERSGAIAAYGKLARDGIRLLRRGGILVAASCSGHVSAGEFFEAVGQAARRSGRVFKVLQTTGHPPDHPATFTEANYLKCIYLGFD
jgi:23S rRNA (cytosine1962-C5)-methyltransferase